MRLSYQIIYLGTNKKYKQRTLRIGMFKLYMTTCGKKFEIVLSANNWDKNEKTN